MHFPKVAVLSIYKTEVKYTKHKISPAYHPASAPHLVVKYYSERGNTFLT